MHGLIHWLASAYAKKGITVNGVAPALIEDTKMVAEAEFVEAMKSSEPDHKPPCQFATSLTTARNPRWTSWPI